MAYNSTNEYLKLLNELGAYHVPKTILHSLSGYVKPIYKSDIENRFSAPMLWIGLYIAFASLVCILSMVADFLHGLCSRRLWFPCKYFRINSFYLTVISVAMKLPVDLTGSMPGLVDQVAKIGSMAFMCIMMANLLPCLATMDDNDLYSNMAALGVLVITMVVNVCIQIKTGVVSTSTYNKDPRITPLVSPKHYVVSLPKSYDMLPIIYALLLLVMLILYVSSFLAVLTSKKHIKAKYKYLHDKASREIQQSLQRFLTVERLQEHVINHWIMAITGSSQFVFTVGFQTTCASGVICVFITILHILTMCWTFKAMLAKDYDSDYSWSMIAIVILQLIGVVIGTFAPLCRCFAPIISLDIRSLSLKVFYVEWHWTGKLHDWRSATIRLPYHLQRVIQTLKRLIFGFCIGFQVVVVVVCKIIALSLHLFSICVKLLLKPMFSSSDGEMSDIWKAEELLLVGQHTVGFGYELCLARRTSESLVKSVKQLIQKGERNQQYVIDLLEKSTRGFYGVGRLVDIIPLGDSLGAHGDMLEVYQNCWSLQVVTLATIACSFPEIKKNETEWLMRSVRECLVYVMVVDEIFNDTFHYIQNPIKLLWEEVDVYHEWLGNKLPDPSSQLNTAREVVEWFYDTGSSTPFEAPISAKITDRNHRGVFLDSMARTLRGVLLPNSWNGDDVFASQQKLFDTLSSIIADMIAACLTNLPQVIINQCHPSVVEEREASVKRAALLLGQTKQIIEIIRQHDIPDINPSDMPFFNKWYAYLRESQIP